LRLAGNRLGDEGVVALASSQHLHRLREVDLSLNGIDSPGLEALLKSPTLKRLKRVGLHMVRLTPREQEQLRSRFGPGAEF
jgi:hypothetical protein